jgi:integrase
MRQGEILALRWQDVDPENVVVSVRCTLTRSGGKVEFDEPKTNKSRRSIRLTSQAVEALRIHLEYPMENIERLGDRYQDQGLVFTNDTGAPINPYNLRQRSFAPLLPRGVHPTFVQELSGHTTIAITLDSYSHVPPSMGVAAATALDEALS